MRAGRSPNSARDRFFYFSGSDAVRDALQELKSETYNLDGIRRALERQHVSGYIQLEEEEAR
jgi:Arc/MetJ-type ribon-helix-helix transcriptional regulator